MRGPEGAVLPAAEGARTGAAAMTAAAAAPAALLHWRKVWGLLREIHCEVARQSAEPQVCLRRLHIQEACAAMAHCGIKAASC